MHNRSVNADAQGSLAASPHLSLFAGYVRRWAPTERSTMRLLSVCLLLAFPAASALAHEAQPPGQPAWLQAKIAEYKSLPPFSPPRSIVATKHEAKNVYYVSPACCDIPSELYDEMGTLLCYPDCGFAGGDGRCRSFFLGREPVATVWQDNRTIGASSPSTSGSKR